MSPFGSGKSDPRGLTECLANRPINTEIMGLSPQYIPRCHKHTAYLEFQKVKLEAQKLIQIQSADHMTYVFI